MSSFTALNTALTSLYAQQRGLEVTGQNVANANTEGYSRQRVVMQSQGGNSVPALWSTQRGAGTGVSVEAVQRLRDGFLESRAQVEHGREASMTAQAEAHARIEQGFGEPGDTGLQNQLSELWASFADLQAAPDAQAQRSAVLNRAQSAADTIRRSAGYLDQQWHVLREQVVTTVDTINRAATNVAELNGAIQRAVKAGLPANELSDQRDMLVMRLADLTGATARGGTDGSVDVMVNGVALVRGTQVETMHVAEANAALDKVGDPVTVTWQGPTGLRVDATSGQLQGELTSLETTVPTYLTRLDGVAAALRDGVNAVHAGGFDLDGAPGEALFLGTGARDLTVGITDYRKLAADSGPDVRDGATASALAALATTGSVDAVYRSLIVELGGSTKALNDRLDIQSTLTTRVDASREAQSGVNLDEEMVNLLGYQHAYEGAARVLTAVDQMLDTLINRTGLVGR